MSKVLRKLIACLALPDIIGNNGLPPIGSRPLSPPAPPPKR